MHIQKIIFIAVIIITSAPMHAGKIVKPIRGIPTVEKRTLPIVSSNKNNDRRGRMLPSRKPNKVKVERVTY